MSKPSLQWDRAAEEVCATIRTIAVLAFIAFIAHGFYLLIMAGKG